MEIIVNGQSLTVANGATVAALLDQLKLAGKPVAVEVNRQLAPRARHAEYGLSPGDQVEVVTLVGGG